MTKLHGGSDSSWFTGARLQERVHHKSSAWTWMPASAARGVLWLLLACAMRSALGAPSAEHLPAFAANVSAISVSGVSSGGYMAVQFHVAHSAIVRGAGVLAAG